MADTTTTPPSAEQQPVADEPAQPVGDVDVADVEPGKGKGEIGPIILPGYWVRLAEHDDVDEAYWGHFGVILDGPWQPAPIGVENSGIPGYTYDKDKLYLVRTRDAANALVEVPEDALAETGQNRVELQPYG